MNAGTKFYVYFALFVMLFAVIYTIASSMYIAPDDAVIGITTDVKLVDKQISDTVDGYGAYHANYVFLFAVSDDDLIIYKTADQAIYNGCDVGENYSVMIYDGHITEVLNYSAGE